MSIVTKQIREGPHYRFRVYAVAERTADNALHCPTLDFFTDAERREPEGLIRLTALLDLIAERGSIRNTQKFKHLTGSDQIFEFRTSQGLRLLCFFDEGQVVICTNGCIKKKQRLDPEQIATAHRWRQKYVDAQLSGELTHEPEHQI